LIGRIIRLSASPSITLLAGSSNSAWNMQAEANEAWLVYINSPL